MHRFYCSAYHSLDCPKCVKQHSGGEDNTIVMFCRGDSKHVKHWFCSLTLCYPYRLKTQKVLNNDHWYFCASKSSKDDDPIVDYVSSQTAADLIQKLNDHANFPVNSFTHNGIGVDSVNSVNKEFPYKYQIHLLEMGYNATGDYPKHYAPQTVHLMLKLTKDADCFVEAY